LVFLDMNGAVIDDPQGELYDPVIAVTIGKANKIKIAHVLYTAIEMTAWVKGSNRAGAS
jgi:hypothetical protein